MNDSARRNMALFQIGIVMKLTGLTARQIRYYEQHGLIRPERTKGNQRLFSFNDVERLLEIKVLIDKGINLAGIKEVLQPPARHQSKENRHSVRHLSDSELHQILKRELRVRDHTGKASLIQGELSRFFYQPYEMDRERER